MKKLLTMMVLAMVIVGFSVVGSDAGVKTIRPDQLKVVFTNENFKQYASLVRSNDGTSCYWTAVVKLPVGKRITKLKYYHRGWLYTGTTFVKLHRVKMGESEQLVAHANSYNITEDIIPVEHTVLNYPVVKSGFTYFLEVCSENDNSEIHGIKIFYRD